MVKPSASPTSSHLAASRLRKLLHHQDSGVSRTWQKLASADEPYEKWRINPAHIDHLKRLGLINDELEPTPEAREAYEMLQAEWERTQSHRVSE